MKTITLLQSFRHGVKKKIRDIQEIYQRKERARSHGEKKSRPQDDKSVYIWKRREKRKEKGWRKEKEKSYNYKEPRLKNNNRK